MELNANYLVWRGTVKEIGFYLSDYVCQRHFNNITYNAKLRWDWAKDIPGRSGEDAATNPLNHEFAILRQQPPGEVLYLMAHVEALAPPPPGAKITVWLRTTQSDRKGIRVWLPYSAPCPFRPNQYHFRKPYGQEIKFHHQFSVNDRYIRLSQKDEGIDELTTYDHARDKKKSNYDDSSELESKLLTHELRGRARFDVGEWREIEPTLPTLLRFIQAAGVEKIVAEAIVQPPHIEVACGREWLPVKNQADILYYSGHGHSSHGGLERWGPNGPTSTFTVNDVNPIANWNEDLDYFIIAGCAVLKPDKTNGFAWGNATLKNNIIRGLCGYYGRSPSDAKGGSVEVVKRFVTYLTTIRPSNYSGDRVLDAWLEANIWGNGAVGSYAIVYNANQYWKVTRKLLKPWRWEVKGPWNWP